MKLSVIVCTRNRAHAIIPCLDSIAAALAHAAPVDAEIVVVNNASIDNTAAVLQEWAGRCSFPVNIQYEAQKGANCARNCGLRASRGDLLVWTDDDCRLSEDHIKDALRHDAADTEPVLRGGRVKLGDPADLPLTIKNDPTPRRWSQSLNSARDGSLINSLLGCNMAFRRSIAERIGDFDERFGPGTSLPGSDEIDYVFRAYLAGFVIEYVPDVIVFHHHGRKSLAEGNKLLRNYIIAGGGRYAKYFFRYPYMCRPYYLRSGASPIRVPGSSPDEPPIGFSVMRNIGFKIIGATRYYIASILRLFHSDYATTGSVRLTAPRKAS